MNKLASYVNYYYTMGKQKALEDLAGTTKTAGLESLIPRSRMGKAMLGLGAAGAGIAGVKAMQPDQPSTLENLYEGGKEMVGNMTQEDIQGYADLINQLRSGEVMGYDSAMGMQADAYPYGLEDLGYYDQPAQDSMGYASQMSPEEMQQYIDYYSQMG